MRMWMIDPKWMCNRHISGEHNEIHKHLPGLYRGVRIEGRMGLWHGRPNKRPIVQIELCSLQSRHDQLAKWLNHSSPLEVDEYWLYRLYPEYYYRSVGLGYNILDLAGRCEKCRDKLREGGLI